MANKKHAAQERRRGDRTVTPNDVRVAGTGGGGAAANDNVIVVAHRTVDEANPYAAAVEMVGGAAPGFFEEEGALQHFLLRGQGGFYGFGGGFYGGGFRGGVATLQTPRRGAQTLREVLVAMEGRRRLRHPGRCQLGRHV